jgi:predicted ester cyclase
MSDQANVATVRRLFEAFGSADPAAVDREIGADFVAHGPGGRTDDAAGWKALARMFLDAMPDVRTELDEVIATGDRVIARFTTRGTLKGELLGVAPTDRPLTTGGIEVYRLEAGRIVECWGAYDMSELFGSVC